MNRDLILQELKFRAVRSGGAGGQHVNKRLTSDSKLLVQCDDSRSQLRNREIAEDRLFKLIEEALKVPKKRKKTSPSKASVEKRLKTKKVVAKKKISRKKPENE